VRFVYIERKNIAAQLVSRLKAEATNDWGWRNRAVSDIQLARHHARFRRRGESDLEARAREADPTLDRLVADLIEEARAVLRNAPIFVDPDRFAAELDKITELNAWGLRQLAPYQPTILYYENLFESSGRFHPKTLQRLGEVAEVDVRDFAEQPFLLKQAPDDFLEGVANRSELIRRFRGTKYAWMFPFW
jgi:hypothetical protein